MLVQYEANIGLAESDRIFLVSSLRGVDSRSRKQETKNKKIQKILSRTKNKIFEIVSGGEARVEEYEQIGFSMVL